MLPRRCLARCTSPCHLPLALRYSSRLASSAAADATSLSPSAPSNAPVGRLAFDASKAGLTKVDKAHVERVIQAASKGSAFFKSEQRKAAERAVRHRAIVAKQRAFRRLPVAERRVWEAKAEAAEARLEATRDFSRRFVHIDLDMFYAAVEEKFDPTLRDRPFAVGGFSMLATSNYIARQYGVRSGMPGFIAKKLCPQLWIVPAHFDRYRAEAATVRSIAATYDPCYVTVGLDELTMDVTDYLVRHNQDITKSRRKRGAKLLTAEDVCAEFRGKVEAATQLTCSGGVSHTAAFAKLASNVNKPNGQHVTSLHSREDVLRHVRDMPVRDIPGVGLATEHQLHALGIRTCGELLAKKAELCYLFAEKTFSFFLSAGMSIVRTHVDRTIAERAALEAQHPPVPPPAAKQDKTKTAAKKQRAPRATPNATPPVVVPPPLLQKSTGKSVTVARGLPSPEAFRMRLRELVRGAHEVLHSQGAGACHVCFTTVDHSFTPHSYSATLPRPTADYTKLHDAIAALAEPFVVRHRDFRLIGVNFSKLQRMPVRVASRVKSATKAAKKPSIPTISHCYPKRRQPAAALARTRSSPPAALTATTVKKKVRAAAKSKMPLGSKKRKAARS